MESLRCVVAIESGAMTDADMEAHAKACRARAIAAGATEEEAQRAENDGYFQALEWFFCGLGRDDGGGSE